MIPYLRPMAERRPTRGPLRRAMTVLCSLDHMLPFDHIRGITGTAAQGTGQLIRKSTTAGTGIYSTGGTSARTLPGVEADISYVRLKPLFLLLHLKSEITSHNMIVLGGSPSWQLAHAGYGADPNFGFSVGGTQGVFQWVRFGKPVTFGIYLPPTNGGSVQARVWTWQEEQFKATLGPGETATYLTTTRLTFSNNYGTPYGAPTTQLLFASWRRDLSMSEFSSIAKNPNVLFDSPHRVTLAGSAAAGFPWLSTLMSRRRR